MRSIFLFATLALTACGTPPPNCPSSCNGCCDERGACQPGNNPLRCGAAGAVCNTCPAGMLCSLGACTRFDSSGPAAGGMNGAVGGGNGAMMGGGAAGGGVIVSPRGLSLTVHQVRQSSGAGRIGPLFIAFTLSNGAGGAPALLNPVLLDVRFASGLIKKPRTTSSPWVDGNAPQPSDALGAGSSFRWVVALDGDARTDAPVELTYSAPTTGIEQARTASAPLTLEPCTTCSGECTYLDRDPENCGACGVFDADGASCVSGQLTACPAGLTRCPTTTGPHRCRDLMTSPNNCGACGQSVPPAGVCINGVPSCAAGQTNCSGRCVDTTRDNSNCGQCGHACGGTTCGLTRSVLVPSSATAGVPGRCTSTVSLSDVSVTGSCASVCAGRGSVCVSSAGTWGGAYAYCNGTHWSGNCTDAFPSSVSPCELTLFGTSVGKGSIVCNCVSP